MSTFLFLSNTNSIPARTEVRENAVIAVVQNKSHGYSFVHNNGEEQNFKIVNCTKIRHITRDYPKLKILMSTHQLEMLHDL